MFRIAFTIGLTLTVCSLSVNASPQAQAAEKEKKAEDNYLKIAKQIITRYDQNADSQLNAEEWEKMLLSPASADANEDQQITVAEYAKWARSKDRSKKSQAKSKTKVSDADAKPILAKKTKAQTKPNEPQNLAEAKDQQLTKQTRNSEENRQAEQKLIEQITRQLEQREREGQQRREMEQRQRPEEGGPERREMVDRERHEIEQQRRHAMQERAPHGQHGQGEQAARELQEERARLRRAYAEAAQQFPENHPQLMEIQRGLEEIRERANRMSHQHHIDTGEHPRANHQQHHNHQQHNQGEAAPHRNHDHENHHPNRDDRRQGPDMPIEKRLELLRIAFDHLDEAGMEDLADETRRRGEELERQLHQHNDHDNHPGNNQIQHLIEESHRAVHAVNQRLDQLQRELQEMRDQFDQLRNQR